MNKKELNLKFEQWDDLYDNRRGTIRTVPENYYVCDVNLDNTLEFGNLEAETKDIDQSTVRAWWDKNRK